jgi:methylmalonyl-CoA mutase cobalamin-binding domain/chain
VEPDERVLVPPAGGGATPEQEIAYSMATAIGVLDAVRDSGRCHPSSSPQVFGSISFFVNAGIRFVEEVCKLRAMTDMWEQIGRERYGVTDDKALRFRYGVQVNSLGLTEASRRTTSSGSCSRCSRSRCRSGHGPLGAAAGVERGARAAAPVGPAVVAADAAGAGLRDRPAGVRRHLRRLMDGLRSNGAEHIKVVLGGIVPESDFEKLFALGVQQVYTPADYELLDIMEAIVGLLDGEPVDTPSAVGAST